MAFHDVSGHAKAVAFLRRSIASGRAGASLLFHGPEGVGRRFTALSLAQALNCPEQPGEGCGTCGSCARIARVESGTIEEGEHKGDFRQFTRHPDVHLVVPGRNEIRIDEIRALRFAAQRRPFEGRRSVFVVDPAERMTPAAANAILKTLEEPPPGTCIVLVAEDPSVLLPTVRSRCILVPFHKVPPAEIEALLSRQGSLEGHDVSLVAALADGRPGRALSFDLESYREKRGALVEILERLARPLPRAHVIKDAEALGSRGEPADAEAALEILESLLRDALLVHAGAPDAALANRDVADRIRSLAASMGGALLEAPGRIARARSDLRWNVNRQLLAEALLLDLAAPA